MFLFQTMGGGRIPKRESTKQHMQCSQF